MEEEKKKDNRREFIGPDGETKYYIAAPTAEDVRGADWQYSKMYTRSLTEGITTSAEMMDILMRRGIIGPEFEQRVSELSKVLGEKISKLNKAEAMDDKRIFAVEVAEAREELFQWNQRLSGPMSNTCEQIADDSRLEYLTSCIVQNEDGSRVWPTYDVYLKEKSQGLALKSRFEVMLFLQGFDSDFLDKTPEALAMKEVEKDVMEKAQEAYKAMQAAMKEADEDIMVKDADNVEAEVSKLDIQQSTVGGKKKKPPVRKK